MCVPPNIIFHFNDRDASNKSSIMILLYLVHNLSALVSRIIKQNDIIYIVYSKSCYGRTLYMQKLLGNYFPRASIKIARDTVFPGEVALYFK